MKFLLNRARFYPLCISALLNGPGDPPDAQSQVKEKALLPNQSLTPYKSMGFYDSTVSTSAPTWAKLSICQMQNLKRMEIKTVLLRLH